VQSHSREVDDDSDDGRSLSADTYRDEYQFSLLELLILMAMLAGILAVARTVGLLIPGGNTVENLAGIMGLAALVSMIVLAIIPFSKRIVLVGWWALLGLYILTALIALFQHK
jgi:hypothetical protein